MIIPEEKDYCKKIRKRCGFEYAVNDMIIPENNCWKKILLYGDNRVINLWSAATEEIAN